VRPSTVPQAACAPGLSSVRIFSGRISGAVHGRRRPARRGYAGWTRQRRNDAASWRRTHHEDRQCRQRVEWARVGGGDPGRGDGDDLGRAP
jgi:hypothetical protein